MPVGLRLRLWPLGGIDRDNGRLDAVGDRDERALDPRERGALLGVGDRAVGGVWATAVAIAAVSAPVRRQWVNLALNQERVRRISSDSRPAPRRVSHVFSLVTCTVP